ncbi:MAG: hypothetical protein WKG00_29980 [Polyangiaceae bacterium]
MGGDVRGRGLGHRAEVGGVRPLRGRIGVAAELADARVGLELEVDEIGADQVGDRRAQLGGGQPPQRPGADGRFQAGLRARLRQPADTAVGVRRSGAAVADVADAPGDGRDAEEDPGPRRPALRVSVRHASACRKRRAGAIAPVRGQRRADAGEVTTAR